MYAPVVPSNPDQNEQSVFRPKMPKNPTFWGVHFHMAYIRESPRPNHFHAWLLETETRSKNGCGE